MVVGCKPMALVVKVKLMARRLGQPENSPLVETAAASVKASLPAVEWAEAMDPAEDLVRGGGTAAVVQIRIIWSASWLIPFAAFACVGLFANLRRRHITQQHKESLFWLAWLVMVMGFFSVAGFFHQYYLIMLAPPIGALVRAGWKERRAAIINHPDGPHGCFLQHPGHSRPPAVHYAPL